VSEEIDVNVELESFDFEDNPSKKYTFYLPKFFAGKTIGVHRVAKNGTVEVICSRERLGAVGRVLQTFGCQMKPFEGIHPGFETPAPQVEDKRKGK